MKGRTPTAEEKRHMNKVAQLGCIVCWLHKGMYTPACVHHLDGKTKQGAHFNVIPLCPIHHDGRVDDEFATSRHPYKRRFEHRYGAESYLLSETLKMLEGK